MANALKSIALIILIASSIISGLISFWTTSVYRSLRNQAQPHSVVQLATRKSPNPVHTFLIGDYRVRCDRSFAASDSRGKIKTFIPITAVSSDEEYEIFVEFPGRQDCGSIPRALTGIAVQTAEPTPNGSDGHRLAQVLCPSCSAADYLREPLESLAAAIFLFGAACFLGFGMVLRTGHTEGESIKTN
jgi:hypothetical protein